MSKADEQSIWKVDLGGLRGLMNGPSHRGIDITSSKVS